MFNQIFGFLIPVDLSLFYFINGLPHFFVTDFLFVALAGITSFGLLWIFIAFYIDKNNKNTKIFPVTIIFALIAYFLVEVLLKDFFGRLRPSLFLPSVIMVGPRVAEFFNTFSFPSGHAFSAFGYLVIFRYFNKKYFYPLFILAMVVAFSRIYLGKHYTFDVFVGAILGVFIAKILLHIFASSLKKN